MKKTPYLLLIACAFSLTISAKTTDDAGHHQMVQYLKLLPDTLYFNQDFTIDMTAAAGQKITVSITDYAIIQSDNHATVMVPWSNRETDMKLFQIYGADKALIGEKPVAIVQKIKGNVSNDNDLFKMDDRVLDLRDNLSPEKFQSIKSFDVNPERFQHKDLHVSGFTVTATATNQKVYNKGSVITDDTRSFLSKLKIGDNIRIENIQGSYQLNGHTQIMDINYYPSITLAPEM